LDLISEENGNYIKKQFSFAKKNRKIKKEKEKGLFQPL